MATTTTQKSTAMQTTPVAPPVPPAQANMSERFTEKVLSEFNGNVSGGLQITDFQRSLIQGYFIGIDRALQVQEEKRLSKNLKNTDPKYNNDLPMIWQNINLKDLALDVVHYARMGLDMMQKNHISPIPFKNNNTNQYDVTLMPGYVGIEYIAKRYALDPPVAVAIELVYSTDTFKPVKKNRDNKVESYEFEINNPFNRGDIIGGFGYIEYDNPTKNKLIMMTKADIEKRKPQYASAEFWGGKKKVWENKKQIEVETDGWYAEMFEKTIKREVFSEKHIQRDPQKIDDAYQYMKMREARMAEIAAQEEIDANANTIIVDATTGEVEQPKLIPTQNKIPQTPVAPADVEEDDLP